MKKIAAALLILTVVITPAAQSQQKFSSDSAMKAKADLAGKDKEQSQMIGVDIDRNGINRQWKIYQPTALIGHSEASYITADYKPTRDNVPIVGHRGANHGPHIFVRKYKIL